MLPPRIAKKPKRETRWRSPAHLSFVRSFACCACHSQVNIQAAHVRLGSHTALGAKPDDFRAVPLCGGGEVGRGQGCHQAQHSQGERSFWKAVKIDPEAMIAALIAASPKRREIELAMKEKANG